MMTDLPTAVLTLCEGDLDIRTHVPSLRKCKVDAVFGRGDPLPGQSSVGPPPKVRFRYPNNWATSNTGA